MQTINTMPTMHNHVGFVQRVLEENGANITDGNQTLVSPNDSVIVGGTLQTYGIVYLVLLAVFCYCRVRFPRVYNVRSWAPNVKCALAENHFGAFDWFWMVWSISDDDFREQCGMDALSFTRIYRFGLRICFVLMFNSLWLMPIYATSPKVSENMHITDFLAMVTVGHVPSGSPRFIATVLAAYIQFGAIMYLLLKEIEWFTEHRHKYLSVAEPRNYTIYVSHIPREFRTSGKLLEYFQSCFSPEAVLEAQVTLYIPTLERQFSIRETLIGKLEHAINVEDVTGKTPHHLDLLTGTGMKVNSIEAYSDDLEEINKEIKKLVDDIGERINPYSFQGDLEVVGGTMKYVSSSVADDCSVSGLSVLTDQSTKNAPLDIDFADNQIAQSVAHSFQGSTSHAEDTGQVIEEAKSGMRMKMTKGISFMMGAPDGSARESGFVTFSNLKTVQAALQQIHNEKPFVFEVAEAPQPEDIYWGNVGKDHKSLQLGKLASIACTGLLCIFWTLPVAFIVSLTEVESLQGTLPFLATWVEAWPALGSVLGQMAPLMLIVVKSLLPIILGEFSKLEGPISSSVLEASLFVKLAIFEIVQTFFVSTFSGSITSEITNIINDPNSIIRLLATSIPGQSSYFIQILFVQTFLGQGLELLRVTPIIIAGIRSRIGPNLTEKERNTTWFGLQPLSDPGEFAFADVVSNGILYWMVLFVYGSMAPATSWLLALCFCILISGYRHQLIFNYPPHPDSGGQLWLGFINIALTCMLIAEVTLLGLLVLKQATLAAPFMIPLIVGTILFNVYVRQRHFLVSSRLPSRAALKQDLKNQASGNMDMSFVRRKYIQPAMQSSESLYPENFGIMEGDQVAFMTPPSSEVDMEEEKDIAFDGDLNIYYSTVGRKRPLP